MDSAWFDLRVLAFAPGAKRRAYSTGRASAAYHYETLELGGVYANGRPALVVHEVGWWGTDRQVVTVNLVDAALEADCFHFRTEIVKRSVLLRRLLRRPFFEAVGGPVPSGMVDDYARTWRMLRAEDRRPVHVVDGLRAALEVQNDARRDAWTIDFDAWDTARMLGDRPVEPSTGSGRWKSGGRLKRPKGANRR